MMLLMTLMPLKAVAPDNQPSSSDFLLRAFVSSWLNDVADDPDAAESRR
jgi:hypothetical protein